MEIETKPVWIQHIGHKWDIIPVFHLHFKIVFLTKIIDFVNQSKTNKIYATVIQEFFQGRSWKVIRRINMIDDATTLVTELKGSRSFESAIITVFVPNHVHRDPKPVATIW
jgi:hypothetical protein